MEHISETLATAASIGNACVFASFSVLLTWSAVSEGGAALILRSDVEAVARDLLSYCSDWPTVVYGPKRVLLTHRRISCTRGFWWVE